MSKKNSYQLKQETKKKLKEIGVKNRKFITLKCIKCKREYHIRINAGSVYTEEYIKSYVCLLCK